MARWLTSVWHCFQSVGTWIKGHWGLLVMILGGVFVLGFAADKGEAYSQLMKQVQAQQAQNAKELSDLQKLQQDQVAKQAQIDQKYQEVMLKIQQDYQSQVQNLDSQKQAEIKAIIATNQDDPVAMATELNTLLGIPLYTVPVS